jgi:hypothetical protein
VVVVVAQPNYSQQTETEKKGRILITNANTGPKNSFLRHRKQEGVLS